MRTPILVFVFAITALSAVSMLASDEPVKSTISEDMFEMENIVAAAREFRLKKGQWPQGGNAEVVAQLISIKIGYNAGRTDQNGRVIDSRGRPFLMLQDEDWFLIATLREDGREIGEHLLVRLHSEGSKRSASLKRQNGNGRTGRKRQNGSCFTTHLFSALSHS